MRRTVVTGMGIVSCLGCDLDSVSRSLRRGESGIVIDPEREKLGFSSSLTGKLKGWNGEARLDRKARKSMGEPALYAMVAALDAIRDAGLPESRLQREDVGVIIGNDSTVAPSAQVAAKVREASYTGALGSGAIFQVMGSTATMNMSTLLGTRGANWTLAAACASGAHALGQGFMLIGSGMQEIVIAGGAQEINWESMAAFDALKAFSASKDPATASKPFSKSRDGLVPSGGAAVLILESYEHASKRGARIYGEIAAYAFSSNGDHLSCPNIAGPVYAMRRALEMARYAPSDIDYVNAHATSTPVGDLMEGRALLEIFGKNGPPVSSTKSITGHECWMSGASEVLYSLLMMRDGFIAGNANLGELDPELEGLAVTPRTLESRPRTFLSNSFGFGGTNSALIVRSVG
jgi:3-oxoacyl-[acyl-carrier-protein] synthase-1